MPRLPTLSIGECFDEARRRLKKKPGSEIMITIVNPADDQVISILSTDNPAMLANAACNFLQLTVEASDTCGCENCALATERCKCALQCWPKPDNVVPFRRN